MVRSIVAVVIVTLQWFSAVALAGQATSPPANNRLSDLLTQMYADVQRNVTEAAEKMPEEHYGFKPTPLVRTFGELVAHIAGAQYTACSFVKGEENPATDAPKVTKSDLIAFLAASNAYCNEVYAAMTDATAMQTRKFESQELLRVHPLIGNISHSNEHYGNMATYMRLKGLVPPSTSRAAR